MLLATQNVTITATHSSVTSLYMGSRANCSSRSRAPGFEPLIAVQIRIWLMVHCTAAQAAATSIQARAWLAGMGGRAGRQADQAVEGEGGGDVAQPDDGRAEHPPVRGARLIRHWVRAMRMMGSSGT